MGKTNLDQFATGLVGTRSPYGAVGNSFNPDYVSGGSSSGSASVVARGLVAFSLGTDTAGSGRVPAGFNNIVGLKPTKGRLSNTGLVSACRTVDCISVFALTVEDAETVAGVAAAYDASDAYSRVNPNTAPVAVGATIKLVDAAAQFGAQVFGFIGIAGAVSWALPNAICRNRHRRDRRPAACGWRWLGRISPGCR
jgi:allophanate hydrolase